MSGMALYSLRQKIYGQADKYVTCNPRKPFHECNWDPDLVSSKDTHSEYLGLCSFRLFECTGWNANKNQGKALVIHWGFLHVFRASTISLVLYSLHVPTVSRDTEGAFFSALPPSQLLKSLHSSYFLLHIANSNSSLVSSVSSPSRLSGFFFLCFIHLCSMKGAEHKEASLQGSYFSQSNFVPKERSLWLQCLQAAGAPSKSLIFFF